MYQTNARVDINHDFLNKNQKSDFLKFKSNFYRASCASAVLAVIVFLSVRHKSDLYKDG